MRWKQDLRIRSVVKSSGDPLHIYAPVIPPMAADPNYDWEQNERRLANGDDDPFPLGFRPSFHLEIEVKAGRLEGAAGFDDLEDVLSDASSNANALELAIHLAGTVEEPQWDWKRVFIMPGTMSFQPLEGKYVGLSFAVDFGVKSRTPTLPKRDGDSW